MSGNLTMGSSNTSSAGVLRLQNAATIGWRDTANGYNYKLGVGAVSAANALQMVPDNVSGVAGSVFQLWSIYNSGANTRPGVEIGSEASSNSTGYINMKCRGRVRLDCGRALRRVPPVSTSRQMGHRTVLVAPSQSTLRRVRPSAPLRSSGSRLRPPSITQRIPCCRPVPPLLNHWCSRGRLLRLLHSRRGRTRLALKSALSRPLEQRF